MKISLPFVLVLFQKIKLVYTICYAVVNLLFSTTTVVVLLIMSRIPVGMLVGSNGLGPSTSRLSGVCSNQLSYEPIYGGGNRVRTDDPLLAGQVLYQLSYTPISLALFRKINAPLKEARNFIKNE